jgi:hypothetical protein
MKVKQILCFMMLATMLSSCFIFDEMKMDKARERLRKEGVKANARVLNVEDLRETVNDNPRVKMTLEVMPEGQDKFIAEVKMVVSRVAIPRRGDFVTVYFNPNDKTDIAVE